jgi:uncharacterized protein YifE (UPF0438 family)
MEIVSLKKFKKMPLKKQKEIFIDVLATPKRNLTSIEREIEKYYKTKMWKVI